jgi:DNA-binding NtrC family response regulator
MAKDEVVEMTPETTLAGPPRTLLLVDNERGILSALHRLLRNEGYEILTAESALAGLEQMRAHKVGVVISDGLMYGMNGAQFLLEVRARFPDTVRIMLTGFTSPQVVHDAIRTCGLFRFLSKPWDNDQLRETIREAFLQYESKAEPARGEVAYHHG